MPPDQGLADKKMSGVKGNKTRLTYTFTANATGSEKLPQLLLERYTSPEHLAKRLACILDFSTRTTWNLGWHHPCIKNGFNNGIVNLLPKIARSVFCKTIFRLTLSQMVLKIFMWRPSRWTSLCVFNQWIRASSNASRLIIKAVLLNMPMTNMLLV